MESSLWGRKKSYEVWGAEPSDERENYQIHEVLKSEMSNKIMDMRHFV